jgi:hypothetical protein
MIPFPIILGRELTLVNLPAGLEPHPKNLAYFLVFYRPEEIRKIGHFKPVLQTLTRNNSCIRSGSHQFQTHFYAKNGWGATSFATESVSQAVPFGVAPGEPIKSTIYN